MKKVFLVFMLVFFLAACRPALGGLSLGQQSEIQTEPVQRGNLEITVGADGVVNAYQTALLLWQTTGSVAQVDVSMGVQVSKDQVLASLEQTSLPQIIILAQSEVVAAQRALDDLLYSQTQQAQALQAVEMAEEALEAAMNPELVQANAQTELANARKEFEEARRQFIIISSPPSQSAIDQSYANLVMAENVLNNTLQEIEKIEQKLRKPERLYKPWESRKLFSSILQGLEIKFARDQRSFEEAKKKYERLLQPADPTDIAVAQAKLASAEARLNQAEREWARVKDGPSAGDIAVLQARLDDAEREWERRKDGPTAADITAAEARLAAAQATLKLARLVAPFSGTITLVDIKPGDQVDPGRLALRLDDLSRLIVEAQVSEVDINKIQPGQPVVLAFDSILAKEYSGVVLEVPAVADSLQGVVNFNVKVELTDADERVKPGMTASATFVIRELEDVLLLPRQAVRFLEGQRVAYVWRDGEAIPVHVTLGPSTESYVQVIEGELKPGDEVVVSVIDQSIVGQ